MPPARLSQRSERSVGFPGPFVVLGIHECNRYGNFQWTLNNPTQFYSANRPEKPRLVFRPYDATLSRTPLPNSTQIGTGYRSYGSYGRATQGRAGDLSYQLRYTDLLLSQNVWVFGFLVPSCLRRFWPVSEKCRCRMLQSSRNHPDITSAGR